MAIDEWASKCFGECAELIRDTVVPADAYGCPYIGLEHIGEGTLSLITTGRTEDVTSLKSKFRKGDILFGKLRPYFRKVIRAPFDGVCSTDIWVVRPKNGVNAGFLFYWMASSDFVDTATRGSEGTKMPRAKWEFVSQIERQVPPLSEQHAIASILGALDDKIELNATMNRTLEEMARAIFRSWFVHFDPVRAKMEGRKPFGMDDATAALFPDSFEESELGKIPKGWSVRTIEDVAERVGMGPFGSSIKVETFVSEGTPIISGQHLHGLVVEDTTHNFISAEHADSLRNAIVGQGDIIFTHAGNIGQVALVPGNSRYQHYVISQRQFYMRCDQSQICPEYVVLFFKSPEGQHRLLANTSSSGVPSIARPVTYLRSIQVLLPPKPVMEEFQGLVRPLLLHLRSNAAESDNLACIRDVLLPKLISGRIRPKDLDGIGGV